jgi:hypothetical protein
VPKLTHDGQKELALLLQIISTFYNYNKEIYNSLTEANQIIEVTDFS